MVKRMVAILSMLALLAGVFSPGAGLEHRAYAASVNIAPQATASASSVSSLGDFGPEKAIDGIRDSNDSRWVSAFGGPHWYELEWPGSVTVAHVKVWSGNMNVPDWQIAAFDIQVWLDGEWQTVESVSGNRQDGYAGEYNDVIFSPVETTKLRMVITGPSVNPIATDARVLELEVFSEEGSIAIDPDKQGQTIEGWGGNLYTLWMRQFAADDPDYYDKMLTELHTTHIRVRNYWYLLERENDNNDAHTFDWSAIASGDQGDMHEEFLALQELENRGLKLSFSPWRFPNWMAGKPYDYDWSNEKMELPAGMDDEYVESLAAYFLYAREHYGVTFDYISVANEPNYKYLSEDVVSGTYIYGMTPSRYSSITAKLKQVLEANQYDAEYIAAETSPGNYTSVKYAKETLESALPGVYDVLAYHAYDRTVKGLNAFADLAEQHQVRIHVGEQENESHINLEGKETWHHAIQNAVAMHDTLVYGGANLLLYFSYSASPGGILVLYDELNKTWHPTYDVLKHFYNRIEPGSVLLESLPSRSYGGDVYTLAFQKPDGQLEVILINRSESESHTISLKAGDRNFLAIMSDESLRHQVEGLVSSTDADGMSITLPPQSIHSLSEVEPSFETLERLTGEFVQGPGAHGIVASLTRKLEDARYFSEQGDSEAAALQLDRYMQCIYRQDGKRIDSGSVQSLEGLVELLKQEL
ncbi:hypothetical protein M6D81_16160 [Paenibacillus sp. J5C_2022]|uniref:galactose-binding domain-containing protein n=1 Tax=Paenibacillus sp. J5C2022 TaxID=2977129 RepID=UPI0021D04136|nr:glycoside hydrolase family 30 beta sandwich domain-containing protein [Paenibacillus sp. J5C2022]MCU6710234.1 hypothetical protein [Paenibacillus sp. J5C2022]